VLLPSESGFDLRRDGRAAGRRNHPATDATEPTEVEAAVIAQLERRHAEIADVASDELRTVAAAFAVPESQLPDERALTQTVVDASADVDQELGAAGSLGALWLRRQERLRDLRTFAREHDLVRDARYPASAWLTLGTVSILVLLESWFNAAYFAEGTDFGLLGGFARALAVSLLNVGGGFAVGRLALPWTAYRHRGVRVLAGIGVTFAAAGALALNLVLAAYRDALQSGPVDTISLGSLLADPLSLSFSSLALLGAGALAWSLSLWKGHASDDPYPRYGSVDRRFRRANQDFALARDAIAGRVVRRVRQVPTDCEAVLTSGHSLLSRLDGIVAEAEWLADAYGTDRQTLRARCAVLLKAWREENRHVRTTEPPSYFVAFPEFAPRVPDRLVGDLVERARAARAAHTRLEHEAHRILKENEARLAATLDRVQRYVRDVMAQDDREGACWQPSPAPVAGGYAR
jgi:hypothetical protein